jgi:hypothetical protein
MTELLWTNGETVISLGNKRVRVKTAAISPTLSHIGITSLSVKGSDVVATPCKRLGSQLETASELTHPGHAGHIETLPITEQTVCSDTIKV